jgi:hypothetical protein
MSFVLNEENTLMLNEYWNIIYSCFKILTTVKISDSVKNMFLREQYAQEFVPSGVFKAQYLGT